MRRLDRKKYLTRGEVARLLTLTHGYTDEIGRRDYVFVALLVNSGLRISELLRVRVGDLSRETVEDEDGAFTLCALDVWDGKGEVSRRVYVNESIYRIVTAFVKGQPNEAFVFQHERNGITRPYTKRAFAYRMKRLLALAGLPLWYSNHSLRHTYAMAYHEQTHSLVALREQLGHKSLSTTQIYVTSPKREYFKNLQAVQPMLAGPRSRAQNGETH